MNAINKYIRFGQFWKERADFYRDIAEALRENELLRDFVDGELSTQTLTCCTRYTFIVVD